MQRVPGPKRASRMASEAAEDERGAAAQVLGNLEAARNREVSAHAGVWNPRHLQNGSRLHLRRLAPRQRRAVEPRVEIGARQRDDLVASEAQSRARDCDL